MHGCLTAGVTASDGSARAWGVVVPLKLLVRAKTRLSAYGDAGRADLALAFAGDVVDAALACPSVRRVLVVTDDRRAAQDLARAGAQVVPDPGTGLDAALERGEALLRAEDPHLGVAALLGDLPSLRPAVLAQALAQVRTRAFVADTSGLGTTLLAAAGVPLAPAYGPGSSARHRASGAAELPAPATLRRDVDTPEDLGEALELGVGPRTSRAVRTLAACS